MIWNTAASTLACLKCAKLDLDVCTTYWWGIISFMARNIFCHMYFRMYTFTYLWCAYEDQVGHQGWESWGKTWLTYEPKFEFIEANSLIITPPIPSRNVQQQPFVVIHHQLDDYSSLVTIIFQAKIMMSNNIQWNIFYIWYVWVCKKLEKGIGYILHTT